MRLHRLLIALGLALGVIALTPAFALAASPIGPDSQANSLLDLDPFTVTAILGTLLPVLVGIVTKASTSSGVKVLLNAILSSVAAVITVSTIDGGGAVISQDTVKAAVLAFIVSVATYAGVWKPLDLTSSPGPDQPAKLANVGVHD